VAVTTRYEPTGPETEFEPGSRNRVLRNRLGVRSIREMERRESEALLRATEHMIDATRSDRRFSANDIRAMHRLWLGDIYEWAGEYRHVNVAKGGFMFAAVLIKWLLASAVHKSIRRGHAPQAQKFAADLLRTLPSYLTLPAGDYRPRRSRAGRLGARRRSPRRIVSGRVPACHARHTGHSICGYG